LRSGIEFLGINNADNELEQWDMPTAHGIRWSHIGIAGTIALALTLAWWRGARRLKKMPAGGGIDGIAQLDPA